VLNMANILKPALQRLVFSGIYHLFGRIRRLRGVKEALREDISLQHQAIETAFNDLKTVIGGEGLLTEAMASFLYDLSNSGLIDQIAISALTKKSPKGTVLAFAALYEIYFPDKIRGLDAGGFLEKLRLMLRASLMREETAHVFLNDQTYQRLDEIGIELAEITRLQFVSLERNDVITPPWLKQKPDEMRLFKEALGATLAPHFDRIRVEGPARTSMDVPAEHIYVPSDLRPLDFNATEVFDPFTRVYSQSDPLSTTDFLRLLDRAVLLGDPGGGKTTLTRMICRSLIAAKDQGDTPLPIFIALRKYYAARKLQPNLPLLEFMLAEIAEQSNSFTVEQLRTPLMYFITFGRALIVFDGLDEIISVAQRRTFVDAVMQFCTTYNLCRYIVTSRKVGYKYASLSMFPTFELASFNKEAIRTYVELSARNVFHRVDAELELNVRRFEEESRKAAPEFVENPLLLSLIVWLFNSTQRIPDNRAQIYGECSQLLFERWDALRALDPDIPDAHRLYGLLAFLARPMYLEGDLQKGATGTWLRKKIREFFISDYNDRAEARAAVAADKFVDHLSGRAWVLREVGHDTFEFTHRTFLEYFFARQLIDECESVNELFDTLGPHILRAEWNVPAHLALQIMVEGKRKHAERAVNRLIDLHERASSSQRAAVVEFIAQATEYLQPPEGSLERICRIVTSEAADNDAWKESFVSLLQTPNEMRRAVLRGLGQGFAELISKNRIPRVAYALDWLKAFSLTREARFSAEVPGRLAFIGGIREYFAEELIAPLETIQNASAAACKARFDIDLVFEPNVVAGYGLRLWQASSDLPLERHDWRWIDSQMMLTEFARCEVERGKLEQLPYARLAIALTRMDYRRLPIAVSRGATVMGSDLSSELSLLSTSDRVWPVDAAGGLCLAAMMYCEAASINFSHEVSRNFYGWTHNILDRHMQDLVGKRIHTFIIEWRAGKARMFPRVWLGGKMASVGSLLR